MNYTKQQAERITRQILQELATGKKTTVPAAAPVALNIPMGVPSRHVRLCRKDMNILFGYDSTLTRSKTLRQPGQYAAEEMVTLRGPKGELNKARVLGPLRSATQMEVSMADDFALDTKTPVRMSGDPLNSPGIKIIGPKRRVVKHNDTIVVWRHIHISPEEARLHDLHDGVEVGIQTNGPRGGVLNHVVVRVTTDAVLKLHIGMEEANGAGLRNGDAVRGIRQAACHG